MSKNHDQTSPETANDVSKRFTRNETNVFVEGHKVQSLARESSQQSQKTNAVKNQAKPSEKAKFEYLKK